MTPASLWLPANCLTSRDAVAPFARIVEAWAANWFSKKGWEVLGTWDAGGSPDASDWRVLREGTQFQVRARPAASRALALAVLGARQQARYSDQDLRLLRRIAGKAIDDLHVRLEEKLAGPSSSEAGYAGGDGRTYTLLIGVVGAAELAIECARSDLVAIVRSTIAASAKRTALEARDDAYASQTLQVAANIGHARLTLEQITALEKGDVIMLDRSCKEPVRLMIGEHQTDLPFHLSEHDGRVALELQDMP